LFQGDANITKRKIKIIVENVRMFHVISLPLQIKLFLNFNLAQQKIQHQHASSIFFFSSTAYK
jgi:hypothetical protein